MCTKSVAHWQKILSYGAEDTSHEWLCGPLKNRFKVYKKQPKRGRHLKFYLAKVGVVDFTWIDTTEQKLADCFICVGRRDRRDLAPLDFEIRHFPLKILAEKMFFS